jgi:hypothetical protein
MIVGATIILLGALVNAIGIRNADSLARQQPAADGEQVQQAGA